MQSNLEALKIYLETAQTLDSIVRFKNNRFNLISERKITKINKDKFYSFDFNDIRTFHCPFPESKDIKIEGNLISFFFNNEPKDLERFKPGEPWLMLEFLQ